MDRVPVLRAADLKEFSPGPNLESEARQVGSDLGLLPRGLLSLHFPAAPASATSSGVRWVSSVLRMTHTVSSS